MRLLTEHIINPVNDQLRVEVVDNPGAGGANHNYLISIPDGEPATQVRIRFQEGPIAEKGINGLTQEVLLAIVADRLRGFQSGHFKCKENACALTHIEEALHWLQQRTLTRMRRGVEGTNVV